MDITEITKNSLLAGTNDIPLNWREYLPENNTADIYTTALDLYRRGLNVFPIPHPKELRAWAAMDSRRDAKKKVPYLLSPLFWSRLHLCDEKCEERRTAQGKDCLPSYAKFEALFGATGDYDPPNLAVMLGKTSENLMVIDCDTLTAFETVLQKMQEKRLPFWAYRSFRGGGLLMRLREGEAKNLPDGYAKLAGVEIYGHQHFIVVPPSLHPEGVFYAWVTTEPVRLPADEKPPLVSVEDLEWLGVRLNKDSETDNKPLNLAGLPSWARNLSRNNQDFLVNGAPYRCRNNRLYQCACDIAGNDISQEEAEPYLFAAIERFSDGIPFSTAEAEATTRSAFSRPRTPARYTGKSTGAEVEYAERFMQGYDWRLWGGKQNSAYKVFGAAVKRAKMEHRRDFRCTVREIAELAGVSDRTAHRTLLRLSGRDMGANNQQAGLPFPLLSFVRHDEINRTAYYKFSKDVLRMGAVFTQYSPLEHDVANSHDLIPTTQAEQDVFGKLGITAWRVWLRLLASPMKTKADIARAIHVSRDSVGRVLRQVNGLTRFGLVEYDGEQGFYAVDPGDDCLTEIAVAIGSYGKAEKKKADHRMERAYRINWMLAKKRENWGKMLWWWSERQENDQEETTS